MTASHIVLNIVASSLSNTRETGNVILQFRTGRQAVWNIKEAQ